MGLLPIGLALAAPKARAPEEPIEVSADQAEGSAGQTVLTGHVVIRQGPVTITSETGIYDRDHHHQSLQGNIRYLDGPLVITALAADHYDDERKAILTGGVTVTDTSGSMTASQATYYRREGRLVLEGNVVARDSTRTLTAQRLTYYKDTRTAVAEGDVKVVDTQEEATLQTTRLNYDREARRLISPVPSELVVMDNGQPTRITSDSLDYNTRSHVASAYGKVRIARDSLAAESGRAVVYRDEKRAVLVVSPRASDSHGATEGDTLELFWNDKELKRVVARTQARAVYRTRPTANREETSTATGDRVVLELKDQRASRVTVSGGAKDEFRGKDLVTGEEDVNTSEGDSIVVGFRDNHARVAVVYNGRTGRYQYEPGSKKSSPEDVRYTAEQVSYDLDKDMVYLRGNARMEYKDLVLNADSVDYDMKRSVLVARGNPRIKDATQEIAGLEMGYDLKNQQGSVQHGVTRYANGLYTGETIKKLSETVLNVNGGDYTTCDDPEPHYRIHSNQMKIYLHDKVVLKPVVFYIRNLPLFALPFYVFPIREGRHSGILFPQFELGLSSTQGRFIRNAGYYWAMNDYMDLSVYGDYEQEQPRWTGNLEFRYKVRYLIEQGDFFAKVSRDLGARSTQWQVRNQHQQRLGERTSLSISGDFISDRSYLTDQGLNRPPDSRVSRNLHSLLALNHGWDGGNLSLALDRNENLAVDSTDTLSELRGEQLPTLNLSLSSRPIGRAPDAAGRGGRLAFLRSTYWSYSGRLAREVHVTRLKSSDRTALGNNFGLSDNRRIFGWLNFGPALSASHALVDQDALGKKLAQGVVWNASFGTSATLYGTFQPHWGPFDGIRHVLSPSVRYFYQPGFKNLNYLDTAGVERPRFPSVAGVGLSSSKQSRLDIGVQNTYQLKLKSGGEIKRLDNFANLSLGASYDFLADEHGQHPWSPVSGNLSVYPGPVGSFSASATYDPYSSLGRAITQFSFNTSFTRGGRLFGFAPDSATSSRRVPLRSSSAPGSPGAYNLSLSYSYGGSAGRDAVNRPAWFQSQRVRTQLGLDLTPNWHFDYSNQFDLSRGISVYQEISARRQLHCWEASFSRRISPGQSEYYFRIGVKDRPEIQYQSGSTGLGGLGGLGGLSSFGGLF